MLAVSTSRLRACATQALPLALVAALKTTATLTTSQASEHHTTTQQIINLRQRVSVFDDSDSDPESELVHTLHTPGTTMRESYCVQII